MKTLGRPAYPLAAERRYMRAMLKRVRAVHDLTMKALAPVLVDARQDANSDPQKVRAARRRIQTLIENGTLKPASERRCVDCSSKASSYDHNRGYDNPESVVPVCESCHHKRTARRGDALPNASTEAALRVVATLAESVAVKIPVPTREVVATGKAIDYAATAKASRDVAKIQDRDTAAAVGVRKEFTPIQWEGWVQDNVRLIKTIDSRYFDEIADLVNKSADGAWGADYLTKQIQSRFGVAKSRARVIARDQVGKLHSQIDRQRHTEAGITHFIWRTSMDERVRKEHVLLEGQTFSYAEGAPGEGLPGQPIQCRCVAEPVIDLDLIEGSGADVPRDPEPIQEQPKETHFTPPELSKEAEDALNAADWRKFDPRVPFTKERLESLLEDMGDSVGYGSLWETFVLPDGTKRDLIVRTFPTSVSGERFDGVEILFDGEAEHRIEYVPGLKPAHRKRLAQMMEARGERVRQWMTDTDFAGELERMINASSSVPISMERFDLDPESLPGFLSSASKAPKIRDNLEAILKRDALNLPSVAEQIEHVRKTGEPRAFAYKQEGWLFNEGEAADLVSARRDFEINNSAEWSVLKDHASRIMDASNRMSSVPSISDYKDLKSWLAEGEEKIAEWKLIRDSAYKEKIRLAKEAAADFEKFAQSLAAKSKQKGSIGWEWKGDHPVYSSTPGELDQKARDRISNAIARVETLFGASLPEDESKRWVNFAFIEDRAHFNTNTDVLNTGRPVDYSTQVHEMGHWMEWNNPTLKEASQAFLMDKVDKSAPVEAMTDEWALDSPFRSSYSAKVYQTSGSFEKTGKGNLDSHSSELRATEITSTAIQEWTDGSDMALQLAEDPELFWWAVSVVRGDFQ